MSTRHERDEWGTETPSIMSPERLSAIRGVLDQSPIIVEHWYFYGSRAPDRLVFDDYDAFDEYLRTQTRPAMQFTFGDSMRSAAMTTRSRMASAQTQTG